MLRSVSPQTSKGELFQRIRCLAHPATRRQQECFWIEGIRPFVQAFDARWPIETVLYSHILLQSNIADMLARRLSAAGVKRVRITPEEFRALSTAQRASGIGAIVRQRWTPLENLDPRRGVCLLVIEQIRSAGNMGTIVRTAEACGVGAIIFVSAQTDPFDPAVVRASMGGLFHIPIVRTDCVTLGQWARQRGVNIVGLSPQAPALWTQIRADGPVAIVLGEERRGLTPQLRALCRQMVRLPMSGTADSLNVGVAAGVMMYELVRRAVRKT